MRVCGKALPPRAAALLTLDFACLVLITPLLFMLPLLTRTPQETASQVVLSFLRLVAAGLACQAIFYYNDLYNLQIVRRPVEMITRVLRAFALLLLLLAIASLVLPRLAPVLPRVLLFTFVLGCIAIVARTLALPRQRERVFILGPGEAVSEVQETILTYPEWNLEIVQIVHPLQLDTVVPHGADPRRSCDRMIVTEPDKLTPATLSRIVDWKMKGLPLEDAQSFVERSTGRIRIDGLSLVGCIYSSRFTNGEGKRILKRLFDLLAATTLLALASPVIACVALAILLQRDGDILFCQQRVGLYGRHFNIYKFRTMTKTVPSDSPRWAAHETHRITRIGHTLRKYRLDELPQLVNILRGEMSLVGPRPEQPSFCRMLAENIPFYEQRHSVPPGLTGWAQVRYHYGSSIAESRRKLEYDLFYVKHLSLWLDCAILLETVKVVLIGRGAV